MNKMNCDYEYKLDTGELFLFNGCNVINYE